MVKHSSREPSGRKSGGQPGHEGITRTPFPERELDHVVDLVPQRCRDCHAPLRGQGVLADAHQVVDVPPASAEVTEYRRFRVTCACGAVTTAELPIEAPSTCVGPRLQAVLTTLTGRYRLSRREAQEVAVSLFGPKAEVSLGTLFALERRSSEALAGVYQEAVGAVRREGVEPTNNRAERALRKAVLWRKGSFGSDSPEGSRFVERMLTVSESLRSQGRPVLDFVETVIRAYALGRPHPSLLPLNSS